MNRTLSRCLRIIFGFQYTTFNHPLFSSFSLFNFQTEVFIHNILAMHSEIYLATLKRVCNINQLSSTHGTRSLASGKLIINATKYTADQLCFAVAAQHQWNTLPNSLMTISNRPFFRK